MNLLRPMLLLPTDLKAKAAVTRQTKTVAFKRFFFFLVRLNPSSL